MEGCWSLPGRRGWKAARIRSEFNCGTCASKKFNFRIIICNIPHISGCVPYHGGCTALPQVCSSYTNLLGSWVYLRDEFSYNFFYNIRYMLKKKWTSLTYWGFRVAAAVRRIFASAVEPEPQPEPQEPEPDFLPWNWNRNAFWIWFGI